MINVEVTGLEKANMALSNELKRLGHLSERFVTKSMISISAQTLPMIPIDTGFLANSEFRRVTKRGEGYEGEIGYGALYATFVHAAPGILKGVPRPNGNGNFWDPDGEPEFLAKGVQAFIEDELDALIRQELGE